MGALRGFGDEFFDYHVEHRSCGEGKEVREYGGQPCRQKDDEQSADGFNDAGERTDEEGTSTAVAGCAHGHGDDSTFRDVLDGYTERDGDGGRHG